MSAQTSAAKTVLDADAIEKALTRIAHEIVEGNPELSHVALVGIHTRGVPLAQRLRRRIGELEGAEVALGQLDITFHRDDVHVRAGEAPRHPQPLVRSTTLDFPLEGMTCVLVDDVLYTGRTIRAAIDALFGYGRPERVQLAVLADRGHRELPIRPDYVGKNLPTARDERIQVELVEVDEIDRVLLIRRSPREPPGDIRRRLARDHTSPGGVLIPLGFSARALPASLPGLVLANQASTNATRRLTMGEIHVMREGFLPPKPPPRRHLISIGDLERDDVERLLATAGSFSRSLEREVKKLPTLRGFTVVNVFYESSTRTSSSFELAAKRLSADTMSIKAAGSSVDKGESLKDTALTLGAYDPDVIVLRHPQIGAPQLVARYTDAHIVNAGDGKHQHPTQALLDLYTIKEELGRLEDVHVAIVGDVLHSRVARSNIQALSLVGAKVTLVGPPTLIPRGIEALGCEVSHEIEAIEAADVVYVLRMQRERMAEGANYVPSLREYTARWGVTPERIRPGQKVMHPGPMNRGVEIDPRVADAADALIETQVRAGLVVRMAVLYDLLTTGPVPVASPEPLEVA